MGSERLINKINQLRDKHQINDIIQEFNFVNEEIAPPKVYLAGGLFNDGDQLFNSMVEDLFEQIGIEYYSPQSAPFNDKSSTTATITNESILQGDLEELLSSDYLFNHLTCPLDNGVASEMGIVLGYNVAKISEGRSNDTIGIISYADDIRFDTVPNPKQKGVDNQTMYINSFTAGISDYGKTDGLGTHYNLYDVIKTIYNDWFNLV